MRTPLGLQGAPSTSSAPLARPPAASPLENASFPRAAAWSACRSTARGRGSTGLPASAAPPLSQMIPAPPGLRTIPLLVLFDGDMWARRLRLGDALDRAIASGLLPPLHVAMLDSLDVGTRWRTLGVPGGHVDVVLDGLLPRIRACYPVSAEGTGTIVAGQSLGGLSALWTLALGEGMVGHAIAQSPALWRFDVAEPTSRRAHTRPRLWPSPQASSQR